MTMLKTFDLKGNKLSFADWISNLSPCETPFVSMIPKEKIDQTQYSWQTDRLAAPSKMGAASTGGTDPVGNPDKEDIDFAPVGFKEGAAFASQNLHYTKVHTNFTQIFRKAVRVTDTTKKISLYGRNSELTYQMEKAGMEIKRDLEHAILNSQEKGRLGTETLHGAFDGFQRLVAPVKVADHDTGAVVHKAVTYEWASSDVRPQWFTKDQVFDLTYNLYLAGARANKIMFHPMHMAQFSDWVSSTDKSTNGGGSTASKLNKRPLHLHRMFDDLDTKYNALVLKIRDPLGQEFTLIPNRHMPVDQLFFFNENDWSQMVLREPEKITLAKMGSSEKQMIEFEVGLRHRNPFASGILKFTEINKHVVDVQIVYPQEGDTTPGDVKAMVKATYRQGDGTPGPHAADNKVVFETFNEAGVRIDNAEVGTVVVTANDSANPEFPEGTVISSHVVKIAKAKKGERLKVVASAKTTPSHVGGADVASLDAYNTRD